MRRVCTEQRGVDQPRLKTLRSSTVYWYKVARLTAVDGGLKGRALLKGAVSVEDLPGVKYKEVSVKA